MLSIVLVISLLLTLPCFATAQVDLDLTNISETALPAYMEGETLQDLGYVERLDKFDTETTDGDVNLDGLINAVDALWVLQYAVGKREFTPQQIEVADVSFGFYKTETHKGIDGKDALLILQYASSSGPFNKDYFPQE